MLELVLNQINNREFHVWDAVVAWRDHIYQAEFYNNTKSNYLTGMLKLIECGIINVYLKLESADEQWANDAKQKVDENPKWSPATKTIRKSCLNSFYNYIKNDFDHKTKPYRRHPKYSEIKFLLSMSKESERIAFIKHTLSNVQDKALTKGISPVELCNALSKINDRDAYIVWLMMHTGEPLKAILDRRKEHLRISLDEYTKSAGLDFEEDNGQLYSKYIPEHITEALKQLCKNSKVYLFETASGKKINRTQVMRNLKQAGYNIGLNFDLTPKVLHGFVCAYMSQDKRSELEKELCFSID